MHSLCQPSFRACWCVCHQMQKTWPHTDTFPAQRHKTSGVNIQLWCQSSHLRNKSFFLVLTFFKTFNSHTGRNPSQDRDSSFTARSLSRPECNATSRLLLHLDWKNHQRRPTSHPFTELVEMFEMDSFFSRLFTTTTSPIQLCECKNWAGFALFNSFFVLHLLK